MNNPPHIPLHSRPLKTAYRLAGLIVAAMMAAAAPAQPPPREQAIPENSYAELGQRLEKRIGDMDWGGGRIGIFVEDAQVPLTACAIDADSPMPPAGLVQAITAAVALDALGPDFRFTTELRVAGRITDKVLSGAIILRGNGDPSLTVQSPDDRDDLWKPFDRWAKLIRQRGIKSVDGPIVGDAGAFDAQLYGPAWPLARVGEAVVPAVSALNFNGNCFDIYWEAGKKDGAIATYTIFPRLPDFIFFANNMRLRQRARADRIFKRGKDGSLVSAEGELALRTKAHDRATVQDPAAYYAAAFKSRLVERGVEVKGRAGSAVEISPGEYPPESELVDTLESPPLIDLLRQMMQYDLALPAETIFKACGRRLAAVAGSGAGSPAPGSFQSGSLAAGQYLDRLRLPGAPCVIFDGSGLSALDRITPRQMVYFLRRAGERADGDAWRELFPRPGDPGMMTERFTKNADNPRDLIRAKPGSGEGVETMAGWADSPRGRRVAFAIMVEGSNLPPVILRSQLDTLATEMTR